MEITGPHISPWFVHTGVVTGVSRTVREGKLWFTSTWFKFLILSHFLLSQWLSKWPGSTPNQCERGLLRSMDTEGKLWPFCKQSPSKFEEKVANDRNLAVLSNKRNCLAHEVKNFKNGWFQVLKIFTKNLFITLSQLYLYLKMTSFSGSFITGTKKYHSSSFHSTS